MKTKLTAALALSFFATSAAALADETPTKTAPAPASASTATTATTTATPTSTTTTTGADVGDSVTPIAPPTEPTSKETVTLYQKNRPNKPLLGIGSAVFLGSYVTTAAITAANPDSNDKSMYMPVVGPWLALKDANYDTSKTLLYGASGVLQGVGLGMAIASFFIPEKTAAVTIQAKNVKMNVTPTSYGAGSAGIGAVGTF